MKRSCMFALVVLVITSMLAACAPAAPSVVEVEKEVPVEKVVEKPVEVVKEVEKEVVVTPEESLPWDGDYEKTPSDLCPPDKEPVGRPVFDAPAPEPYEGEQVKEVWVQHGLFANEQGELFRMDVIGVTPEAIKLYTEKVRVCLDQIFTGEVTGGEPSKPGFDQPSKEFGVNPEDLSIEVYLLGFFNPQEISGEEVIKEVFDVPAQRWADMLKEMKLTPEQARPEEFRQDYVVDFVIDPTANNGSTHHYPERSAMKACANVSVASGGGSVRAKLCRNSGSVDTTTVTKGGALESDELSNDNLGTRATYDLGVKGNASGTYRVSGRWGWAGWSAAYLDPAPVGSLQNCNP